MLGLNVCHLFVALSRLNSFTTGPQSAHYQLCSSLPVDLLTELVVCQRQTGHLTNEEFYVFVFQPIEIGKFEISSGYFCVASF